MSKEHSQLEEHPSLLRHINDFNWLLEPIIYDNNRTALREQLDKLVRSYDFPVDKFNSVYPNANSDATTMLLYDLNTHLAPICNASLESSDAVYATLRSCQTVYQELFDLVLAPTHDKTYSQTDDTNVNIRYKKFLADLASEVANTQSDWAVPILTSLKEPYGLSVVMDVIANNTQDITLARMFPDYKTGHEDVGFYSLKAFLTECRLGQGYSGRCILTIARAMTLVNKFQETIRSSHLMKHIESTADYSSEELIKRTSTDDLFHVYLSAKSLLENLHSFVSVYISEKQDMWDIVRTPLLLPLLYIIEKRRSATTDVYSTAMFTTTYESVKKFMLTEMPEYGNEGVMRLWEYLDSIGNELYGSMYPDIKDMIIQKNDEKRQQKKRGFFLPLFSFGKKKKKSSS